MKEKIESTISTLSSVADQIETAYNEGVLEGWDEKSFS